MSARRGMSAVCGDKCEGWLNSLSASLSRIFCRMHAHVLVYNYVHRCESEHATLCTCSCACMLACIHVGILCSSVCMLVRVRESVSVPSIASSSLIACAHAWYTTSSCSVECWEDDPRCCCRSPSREERRPRHAAVRVRSESFCARKRQRGTRHAEL